MWCCWREFRGRCTFCSVLLVIIFFVVIGSIFIIFDVSVEVLN